MKNRIIFSTILILLVVTLNVLLFCVDRKTINNSFKLNSNNIAVMVFDETENDYVRQNSVPTGDYVLNESLSYCEGKGVIDDYDNVLGVVTTKIKGQDKCYFYFDEGTYALVTKDFYYTGGEQTLILPKTGNVTIEAWGAQGGSANTSGGYGAYAVGTINLSRGTTLYINVGGAGTNASKPTAGIGGYNGGANGGEGYSSSLNGGGGGGGASSVALSSGTLYALGQANKQNDVIIVAAGGGGGGHGSTVGYAGGIESNIVYPDSTTSPNVAKATQSVGYAFGLGQTGRKASTSSGSNVGEGSGGGGGGYFGGYAIQTTANNTALSGTGGSSYIGYSTLTNRKMVCYTGCTTSSVPSTYTEAIACAESTPTSECSKTGNGHIKITYYAMVTEKTFTTQTSTQTYNVPKNGYYKLEVWGAQGGGRVNVSTAKYGYGSYSVGTIYLTKNTTLYINVGSKGEDATTPTGGAGGYNGGGTGGNAYQSNLYGGGGGGGATSIALSTGTLYQLGQNSKQSDVIIVAGGGGGSGNESTRGHAGGIQSNVVYGMTGTTVLNSYSVSAATQSAGYAFGLGQNGRTGASASNGGEGSGGGGGGYYGGYAKTTTGYQTALSGAGGSGYIGYSTLDNKHMTCYECTTDTNTATYTNSNTCAEDDPTPDCSKLGDGYAKITYLGASNETLSSKIVAGTTGTHNTYSWAIVNEGGGLRYEGKDPANYVCFSSSCSDSTLYRIIGKFTEMVDTTGNGVADTNQSVIKITKELYDGSNPYDSNGSNNWTNSSLNSYLNNTWTKPYNRILTVRWSLKGPSGPANTAESWYNNEQSGSVYSGYPTYIDSKIALPYASDFGYGALESQCARSTSLGYGGYNNSCYQYTWVYDQNNTHIYYYLLTSYPGDTTHAYYVDGYGYVAYSYGSNNVTNSFGTKPTFYISNDTTISGGTGTRNDPYLIN